MTERKRLVYTTDIAIRWGDMDALAHVNNSRYFTYFEQVRTEWLSELGYSTRPQDASGPILLSSSCLFLKPLTFPGDITVNCYIADPGRSSFMTYYDIISDDKVCAQGDAKIVWIDYTQHKSIPFPDNIRSLFT